MMARGQTLPTLEDLGLPPKTQAQSLQYWFDEDQSKINTSTSVNGTQILDASSLFDGIHTVHYTVVCSDGTTTPVASSVFYKITSLPIQTLQYWFDEADSNMKTLPGNSGVQVLDVSSLEEGIHVIHCQVKGKDGSVYSISSNIFTKFSVDVGAEITASKMIYWYDNATDFIETDVVNGVKSLETTSLADGIHTIHYAVRYNDGTFSPVSSSVFFKTTTTTMTKALRYWFDEENNPTETTLTGGLEKLETTSLAEGIHTIHYAVRYNDGTMSPVSSSVFFKTTTTTMPKTLRYWFDEENNPTETTLAGGLQKLNTTGLNAGLHVVHYQILDTQGQVSSTRSAMFFNDYEIAIDGGVNRIAKYEYWQNDDSQAIESVIVSNASNPYQLTGLLPMKQAPIRSSCFHFEVTDGKPTIYAKNDFYIRFYDAKGYFDHNHKQFVDYQVKQEVTDITLLESGYPQEFSAPAENTIKWFKVTAQRGDSLAFRVSKACSMQLFSPSGEEIFKAEGYEALSYGGAHAPEDGTYYLALHDAASKSGSLKVEYQHIDKYAVLAYTPNNVGCASSSFTMNLDGNGYDNLHSVVLRKEGFEIVPKSFYASSKSEAAIQFVLSGEESLGQYDLILNFIDNDEAEELSLPNAVSLTEPIYGNVETDVVTEPIIASPYPITIKVKNTGNVAQTLIPFFFAYDNADIIEDIQFNNFNVIVDKKYAEAGLRLDNITDNLLGKGVKGRYFSLMIPELGPNEEIDLEVGVIAPSGARFNLYAWTDLAWSLRTNQVAKKATYRKGTRAPQSTACMPDPCELLSTLVDAASCPCNMIMANIEALANLYAALQMHTNMESIKAAGYNSYWEMKEDLGIEMDMFERRRLRNPHDILWRLAENCGSENLTHFMSMWHMMQQQGSEDDCPDPDPHPVDILDPNDPNDIIGYTSESGSKFIREEITNVYYTIEFENDPKIANAAAHTIVVKDTLDTSRFDLSTFRAKSIKLGSKVTELNGEKSFSNKTIDLRPAVNVVAQVSLSLDEQKGIATWTIESLDPLSLKPTLYAYQGVLPVNTNGNGQGEVSFDIKLKPGMSDGDELNNRAGIVFDDQPTILTPTWTNIVDGVLPVSRITEVVKTDDSKLRVSVSIEDSRSLPWKYDVFMQNDQEGVWQKAASNVPAESLAEIPIRDGLNYGFYVVATDMAGNVELKEAKPEYEYIQVEKLILDKTELTIAKGQTEMLTATCPSSWTDKSVIWESSNTGIVIVSTDGKVKGVKAGTATITCTSNATGLKATCTVHVGYVELDKSEAVIEKDKTLTLKATVYPSSADQSVTWESSDTEIVTVSTDGKLKGVKAGTATITCTSNATGLKATCTVTVGYVELNNAKVNLEKGKTMTLKATFYPSSTDQSVTWESSNTDIVTVSTDGKVKGVKAGTATITCTSNKTGLQATWTVTVSYVKLDKTEANLEKGKTLTLTATVYPSSLSDRSVIWESSNTAVATVTSAGKVKGVKAGTATITATSKETGLKETCEVTVGYVKLDQLEATVEKGKTVTLKATVYPSSLTDKTVTWKSSDTKIATVSTAGKVKGVKAGTATITCTSKATGLTATCTVTVGYVKLDKTEVNLEKDKTLTLTATVYPSSLTDKTVTWKSSDTKIATVSTAGKVKGVKAGTATITATSKATGLTATCKVTVGYVKLDKTEAVVEKGKTMTLKATVYPSALSDKTVTWKSSDTKIATVSTAGKVKGVKAGTATITCTSNATGMTATCKVTVGYVKLDKTEATVEKGKTVTLKATVYPSALTDRTVTWKSSNTKIATVTSAGKVKGVKAGTVTITATSKATGLKATCTVTVENGKVTLNKTEVRIQKGKTVTLKATVTPSSLKDKSVTWKSSNTKIATVTAEGKVKGIKAGTATITCTSNATGKKATCTVTVLQSMVSLPFNDDEMLEDEMDNPGVEEPFDVYDLNGRMVKSQVTSLDGLPRGIYIINGKKVMKH